MCEIKREMHHRSLGREELRRAGWGNYPNSREETNERDSGTTSPRNQTGRQDASREQAGSPRPVEQI